MHRSLVSTAGSQIKRHLSHGIRPPPAVPFLEILTRNPELDAEDAQNELRWMKQTLSPGDERGLALLVERRAKGEPLQYILASVDFGPLMLKCRAPTLIPRPETAHIFGRLAAVLSACRGHNASHISIVDMCTGSAPIPLLLRHHLANQTRIKGYDYSQSAIQLARDNIASVGLDVQVEEADIFDRNFSDTVKSDMGGLVDMVISNPPYIPLAEYRDLPDSVRQWEDPAALLGDTKGGHSGLHFYERIAELLPSLLSPREELKHKGRDDVPRVAVEIGSTQGKDVMSILRGGGMSKVEVWQDQFDKDRMVLGWD